MTTHAAMGRYVYCISRGDAPVPEAPGIADGAIDLLVPEGHPGPTGLVVSAAAGSDADEAGRVVRRHPTALVEDLETWGVALACRAFDTPLAVVRAVSNEVGVDDKRRWDLPGALTALRNALPVALAALRG